MPFSIAVSNIALAGAIPPKSVVSACYDLFKLAQPDNYDDILRSWYRLRLVTEAGDMSASKRTRDFKKHTDKIDALVGALLSLHISELIFIGPVRLEPLRL